MNEQQSTNDDPLDGVLQSWGEQGAGTLPRDLKGQVLRRMTARPVAEYRATFALAAGLLVCLCLSALWWGSENPPDVQLAVEPASPPAAPVSRAEIEQQIASLDARLRCTELESRIEKQDAEIRKLQQLLANQRLELDRAQVRKEVVSEWLANSH